MHDILGPSSTERVNWDTEDLNILVPGGAPPNEQSCLVGAKTKL